MSTTTIRRWVSVLFLVLVAAPGLLWGTHQRAAAQNASPPDSPEREFDTLANTDNARTTAGCASGNAIAAGPLQLVSAANAVLKITTLDGSPISGGLLQLEALFGTPLNPACDPRLLFDEKIGRFVLAIKQVDFDRRTSRCLVAVSKSGDLTAPDPGNPAKNWHLFSYDLARNGPLGPEWGDAPSLGSDANAFYLAFDMYAFASRDFTGNQVLILDKSLAAMGVQPPAGVLQDLPYLPYPFLSPRDQASYRRDDLPVLPQFKDRAFGIKPVESVGSEPLDANRPGLLLSHAGSSSLAGLALYTIVDPLGRQGIGPKVGTMTLIPTWTRSSHGPAGKAPQPPPGFNNPAPLETGDLRLQKTVCRKGILWTCRTLSSTGQPGGRALVRFYRIDPARIDAQGKPLSGLLTDEESISDGRIHFFHPSIMPDDQGNAIAVFHGSNDDTVYPSLFCARYQATEHRFGAYQRSEGCTGSQSYVAAAGDSGRWCENTDAALDVAGGGRSIWCQGALPQAPGLQAAAGTGGWTLHAAEVAGAEPYRVVSVVFEAINNPLFGNTKANGGLSIFPEKVTPGDTVENNTVKVRAVVEPAVAGVDFYFRVFDMDYFLSDAAPIDLNGTAGMDNIKDGTMTPPGGIFVGGTDRISAKTVLNGGKAEAEVTLRVSRQPGNNFKVTATSEKSYSDALQINASGTGIVDAQGRTLPTAIGKRTDLLTVWRTLHVELDSMGLVAGNPPGEDDQLKNGDDVPGPDFFMKEFLEIAMSAAYVRVDYLDTKLGDDTVTFRLNVEDKDKQGNDDPTQVLAAQDWDTFAQNQREYWVAYILIAFQGPAARDGDPDGEPTRLGITPLPSGGSLIYYEVNFEEVMPPSGEEQLVITFIHEPGHVFSGPGEPITINNNKGFEYEPRVIAEILRTLKPAGRSPREVAPP